MKDFAKRYSHFIGALLVFTLILEYDRVLNIFDSNDIWEVEIQQEVDQDFRVKENTSLHNSIIQKVLSQNMTEISDGGVVLVEGGEALTAISVVSPKSCPLVLNDILDYQLLVDEMGASYLTLLLIGSAPMDNNHYLLDQLGPKTLSLPASSLEGEYDLDILESQSLMLIVNSVTAEIVSVIPLVARTSPLSQKRSILENAIAKARLSNKTMETIP